VPETTQTNFGVMLTCWDRLAGSLVRRDTADDERYGVPGEMDTYPQPFLAAFRQPLVENLATRRVSRDTPSAATSAALVDVTRSRRDAD
jgi:hypothetical protein